jgi:hypothetical protein
MPSGSQQARSLSENVVSRGETEFEYQESQLAVITEISDMSG